MNHLEQEQLRIHDSRSHRNESQLDTSLANDPYRKIGPRVSFSFVLYSFLNVIIALYLLKCIIFPCSYCSYLFFGYLPCSQLTRSCFNFYGLYYYWNANEDGILIILIIFVLFYILFITTFICM